MTTSVCEAERVRLWAAANSSTTEVTLYLSNLSAECTRSVLMEWMDFQGCLEGCDYLHVPRNFQTGVCFGYAFVNYVDDAAAQRLVSSARCSSMKVEVSTVQGLVDNMARWIVGRVRHIRDPQNLPFVRALEERGVRNPIATASKDSGPKVGEVPIPSFRPRVGAAGGPSERGGVAEAGWSTQPRARSASELAEAVLLDWPFRGLHDVVVYL